MWTQLAKSLKATKTCEYIFTSVLNEYALKKKESHSANHKPRLNKELRKVIKV